MEPLVRRRTMATYRIITNKDQAVQKSCRIRYRLSHKTHRKDRVGVKVNKKVSISCKRTTNFLLRSRKFPTKINRVTSILSFRTNETIASRCSFIQAMLQTKLEVRFPVIQAVMWAQVQGTHRSDKSKIGNACKTLVNSQMRPNTKTSWMEMCQSKVDHERTVSISCGRLLTLSSRNR